MYMVSEARLAFRFFLLLPSIFRLYSFTNRFTSVLLFYVYSVSLSTFPPHSFGHNIDSLARHEMNSSFFFKFFVLVVCATDKNEKTSLSDYEAIFRLFSFCPLLLCRVSCLYFAVEKLQMARHVFLANSHKFEREKKIFVNCTFVYPQFVASLVFLDAN